MYVRGQLRARVLRASRAAAHATCTIDSRADGLALSHSAPAAVKPAAADPSHSASVTDGVALPHRRAARTERVGHTRAGGAGLSRVRLGTGHNRSDSRLSVFGGAGGRCRLHLDAKTREHHAEPVRPPAAAPHPPALARSASTRKRSRRLCSRRCSAQRNDAANRARGNVVARFRASRPCAHRSSVQRATATAARLPGGSVAPRGGDRAAEAARTVRPGVRPERAPAAHSHDIG
eukprot:7209308-Prymnesium_polylepis.2